MDVTKIENSEEIKDEAEFVRLNYKELSAAQMQIKSIEYFFNMNKRRTVRDFSSKKISREIIENCLKTAGTAPSGANKQPCEFFVIESPEVKNKIREAAEYEEYLFYNDRAPKSWIEDLKKFKTTPIKEHLSKAPTFIAIFSKPYDLIDGERKNNYYSIESTGLATGFLISALHNANLASLTHTPSPMAFLNEIVGAPKHFRPFLLLTVGYPEEGTLVPKQDRKSLDKIAHFL